MLIIGTTFSNKSVHINISDCPVRISNDTVILKNKPNSELIKNFSIRRKDGNIEEYSYVFGENFKFCGYVIYKDGFKVYNPSTKQVSEILDGYSFMINTNIKQMSILSEISEQIKVRYREEEFLFKHIIGQIDNGLIIYTIRGPRIIQIEDESEVTVV